MQTKNAIGTRQTTVLLDGDVTAVDFGHAYLYYAVRNDGESSIYVSTESSKCAAGENGVVCVPAGESYVHYNGYNGSTAIYVCGRGTAAVVAQDDANNPFKSAQGGGGIKYINGIAAVNGELALTQSLIPSDGTAYQFPYYIQSGSVAINYSSTTAAAQISVTFPVSFKSEPILLLSSSKGTSGANQIIPVTINHKDLSNQGFTLMPWTGTSYTMKNTIANWVAMGIIDV